MIIGIDIRVLGSPQKSGIQEYTEQLLEHMLPLDQNIQFKLFYSSFLQPLKDYPWLHGSNVILKKFRIPNRLLFSSALILDYPKLDLLLGGVDVFFSPHFFLAPLSGDVRRVITFHDLSYERFPEFFSWRKQLWHNVEMHPAWQAQFADRIITVSDSTKHDLEEYYEVDPSKISRVYSGVTPLTRPGDDQLEEFRCQNNLPKKFILFLGTLEPRKNITGLIRALELIKKENQFADLELVIAGSRGWNYGEILTAAEKSPHHQQIHFFDTVADDERPYLYSLAQALVYPSFFEGFGFPPLEAMQCGTPVITSHTSSLPEVVGEAGLLVDPYSVSSIAWAIKQVLTDEDLWRRLVEKGRQRVGQFSWQNCAQQTLEVIIS